MTQIGIGTDIPVVHTVELLDWARGGPAPHGWDIPAELVTAPAAAAPAVNPLAAALGVERACPKPLGGAFGQSRAGAPHAPLTSSASPGDEPSPRRGAARRRGG